KTASASASPTRRSRAGWRNVRRSAGYMRWSDPRRRTRSPCQGSGPESRDLAELDRAVLAPGTPRGFGDAERLERVCRRARIVRLAARETEEVRELGAIGVTEPDEKGRICRTAERRRVGFHRADRRSWIHSDGDRVLGAVDLDADVVSGLVMTAGDDRADRTAAQFQQHRRSRDVLHGLIRRMPQRGTIRAHLRDLVVEE